MILIAAIFSVIILIFLKFSDFQKVVEAVKEAKIIFIVLALFTQILTYISVVLFINNLLLIQHTKIKFFKSFKAVLSINFLNVAFPSGGLSGTSFLFYFFSKEKIKKGISAVVVVLYYLFNNLSFYFFLIGVIIYLVARNEINVEEFIASGLGFLVTVILTVGVYLFFRKRTLFEKVLRFILSKLNRISRRLIKRELLEEEEIFMMIEEFYRGWREVKGRKKQMFKSLLYAILVHVFDILTVFFIFKALNYEISIAILIIGFVLADVFSFVSLVPSGFIIFEASLALIYSGFGVPLELAILAVLIFRFLALWLPMPIGFWSYRSLTKGYNKKV